MLTYSIQGLLQGIVDYGFYIFFGAILGSIIFGWVGGYPSNRFLQVVHDAVHALADPILMPLRSRLPPLRLGGIGLDLSPIVAIIGLFIARSLLGTIIELFVGPITG